MKKIEKLATYCLALLMTSATMLSCNDEERTSGETSARGTLFRLDTSSGESTALPVNYYLFQNDTLSKKGNGLSSPFRLTVPKGARIFFFAGATEPSALSAIEVGNTTLEEFSEIRTNRNESPDAFYTAGLLRETDATVYSIPLTIGEAQIDLDATSQDHLWITRIRIENTSSSTRVFERESPTDDLIERTEKTLVFNPPVKGKKENIVRLYESGTPLTFKVDGEYDGVPMTFNASLPNVKRNTKYTLRVKSAGAEMTGHFSSSEWAEADTLNAGIHGDENIRIDAALSEFPAGTVVSESGQALTVPYTGGDMTLAFRVQSAVDFESIIDELSNLDTTLIETRRDDDKILTRYRIHVKGQGENTLPYTTTLKVKSVLRQHSANPITLIVNCPPLYIREVTLGGVTWMAFNARSRDAADQIYPMKGYNVEQMYRNEWLTTLGGIFQHSRSYRYIPWESGVNNQGNQTTDLPWTEAANSPCPEGYRVPATDEAMDLFGQGNQVPGAWTYNGEQITASEVTVGQISVNGVAGTAKYLKLSGSRGGQMFIPYGGMKSAASPSAKDPEFAKGFRLWTSDTEDGKAWSIFYGNLTSIETNVKAFRREKIDPESYAYVRCIKK